MLWRRFLRFSVRGLIVLVIVVGVWLGWIVRSARIQREAVAVINDAGGGVRCDWQSKKGKYVRRKQPWAPRWLVDLIGVDYFGHVTAVELFQPISDRVLVQVGRLPGMQLLDLNGTSTSDAGLAHLKAQLHSRLRRQAGPPKGPDQARRAHLSGTQVTDAGVNELKQALASLKIAR